MQNVEVYRPNIDSITVSLSATPTTAEYNRIDSTDNISEDLDIPKILLNQKREAEKSAPNFLPLENY